VKTADFLISKSATNANYGFQDIKNKNPISNTGNRVL
jgi:hypothetical protein